jgi:tetratricopeptide (TPR) repeat protein
MAAPSDALMLAIEHHRAGRLQAAAQIYRQILQVEPKHVDAIHHLGLIAHQTGNHELAVEYLRQAIAINGSAAVFHYGLGEAYRALRRMPEAIACYRRALEINPDFAGVHINLGNALKGQGKLDEAAACYRRAVELKPDFAQAHYDLGVVLKDLGKLGEAIACFRRALELKPDFADAHDNLGSALEQSSDLEGAEDCFRAALRHDPQSAVAHYKLAKFLGVKLPEEYLAAQRRLLENMQLPDAKRLLLHFGLAHALDARGEYAEAAEHLARGNALKRSERRKCGQEYDPKEHEFLVTQMIATCTPDFFARVRGFGLEDELPVFIVGLPRSGTTLVEQILASHSQVFGAGEIGLVWDTTAALAGADANYVKGIGQLDRPTACHLAAQHLEKLRALNPTALRIVDKMPDNYLYLGLLATLFPRAKLIHCRRDLRDVAVSCWMTYFQEVPWANDQQHIAARFHE